ncbi:MAG: hypothetical protein WA476_14695, partial [Acidobacteriaceae bacterium]
SLAVAIIYYLQLRQMQRATGAAESAAKTASGQLELVRQQFRMDQRPYLSPEPRGDTTIPGGKTAIFSINRDSGVIALAISVDLRNIGKSPAVDIRVTPTQYRIGPRTEIEREVAEYVPRYPLELGSSAAMGTALTPPSGVRILRPDEFKHIQDGTWELFIIGAASYRDIFSLLITPYETTYCYLFVPRGLPLHDCGFKPPAFGNAMK